MDWNRDVVWRVDACSGERGERGRRAVAPQLAPPVVAWVDGLDTHFPRSGAAGMLPWVVSLAQAGVGAVSVIPAGVG